MAVDFVPSNSTSAGSPPSSTNVATLRRDGAEYQKVLLAPTYDSGVILLTTSFVAPFGLDLLGSVLCLYRADESQTTEVLVDVQNGNNEPIVPPKTRLGPSGIIMIPLHGRLLSGGFKWKADTANAVYGQVCGFHKDDN